MFKKELMFVPKEFLKKSIKSRSIHQSKDGIRNPEPSIVENGIESVPKEIL